MKRKIRTMKKIIEGYRLAREKIRIVGVARNRTSFMLENKSILEFGNNFERVFKECTNKKTKDILFKKYLLTKYKKQTQVFDELNILNTNEDTIFECVLQLALSGKVKNRIVVGCCHEYMVEIYPTHTSTSDKKFYVFCRKYAEWQYNPDKKHTSFHWDKNKKRSKYIF